MVNFRTHILLNTSDGQYIALGGRDNSIYIYTVTTRGTKYSRLGKCTGHTSFILHLDWSEDSQHLRSVSGDYELLYWSAANCRQVTSPSAMRDVRWATQKCHLGFEVAGIWSADHDGTDINAVCRSHSTRLLATADDFGQVNLFRYPTCQLKVCRLVGSSFISSSLLILFCLPSE